MNDSPFMKLNLLENTTSSSAILFEQGSEVCFQIDKPHHYEIFIEVEQSKLNALVGSPSKLYRMLSNSNQTTGYVQNRKWWGNMFSGGEYFVFETNEKTYIHFKLALTSINNLPSELQVKWRFAKAMRGLRFEINIGKDSPIIKEKINAVNAFLIEHRYIGAWYKELHQFQ
jgi:hypothetical protein